MKLWALGDLHLANRLNREGIEAMPAHPEDWLALVGDVGESEEVLRWALSVLEEKFHRLLWVPGNHDLWSRKSDPYRGEAKYRHLVEICRGHGVITPEDPFPLWPHPGPDGRPYLLAPLFLLYDYSFRPDSIPQDRAVEWAAESNVLCSDEMLLKPEPYPSREAWCAARLALSIERLEAARAANPEARSILINHWPLRRDLVRLRRIPRFTIWCGTRATEDWHRRFDAAAVVHGHLHIKATDFRDGVRFEECSLGYPRDWNQQRGAAFYLRQILPEPETPLSRSF